MDGKFDLMPYYPFFTIISPTSYPINHRNLQHQKNNPEIIWLIYFNNQVEGKRWFLAQLNRSFTKSYIKNLPNLVIRDTEFKYGKNKFIRALLGRYVSSEILVKIVKE